MNGFCLVGDLAWVWSVTYGTPSIVYIPLSYRALSPFDCIALQELAQNCKQLFMYMNNFDKGVAPAICLCILGCSKLFNIHSTDVIFWNSLFHGVRKHHTKNKI